MDAQVGLSKNLSTNRFLRYGVIGLCCALAGCKGRSLTDDNPVFAEAPPRRSLSNQSTVADRQTESNIQQVSVATSTSVLTGNSIVAEVNGKPIFVDDLIGSVRASLDADTSIPEDQKQKILYAQIRKRLDAYVEQEIVLAELHRDVPADRLAMVEESLDEPFQEVLGNIRKDTRTTTDAELNEVLAQQGLSIPLLRESFVRVQKVQGYLSTKASAPKQIDRLAMVDYYSRHKSDFTTKERVRWQEISIEFQRHGGRDGAEKVMVNVVKELKDGADFGDIAVKYSDALSAEKRGDMGWLERKSLADKELEKLLYELPTGKMTRVFVRDDRFEVYRVKDHQQARTAPFQEVQQEVEHQLRKEQNIEARKKVLDQIRARATVVTMFDDEQKPQAPAASDFGMPGI